jgi:antitoxin component YwqK of YwqJK toxin-antitoxin module
MVLIYDFLSCFSLKDMNDKNIFSKDDLKKNNAVKMFNDNIINRLRPYYLPCKAKIYLENINEAKLITILRQVLKIFNKTTKSIKKTKNKEKIIFYKIIELNSESDKFKINNQNMKVVEFN